MARGAKFTNAISVTVPPGNTLAFLHGIRVDSRPRIPNKVECDRASPLRVVAVDGTTLTFFNPATEIATAVFYATLEFSTQRDPTDTDVSYWQGLAIPTATAGGPGLMSAVQAAQLAALVAASLATITGVAAFDSTQDYVDVVFAPAFAAPPTQVRAFAPVITDGEGPVVPWVTVVTKDGFRLNVSAQFTGAISWEAIA